MTFDLISVAVFVIVAALYAALLPPRWRTWALMIGSAIAIFIMQPRLQIRWLDFALPSLTLIITVATWAITRPPDEEPLSAAHNRAALLLVGLVVAGMSLFRYVDADFRLTPSRPPEPLAVLLTLIVALAIIALLGMLSRRLPSPTLWGALIALIGAFVVLKTEPFAAGLSALLRTQTGQDASLAAMIDLNWLGFSYVAFRLIHTVRDRQRGILPALNLRDYVTYVIFAPAFTAGPIDRAERFLSDLQQLPQKVGLDADRFTHGLTRISVGIFKKFIVADTLAQGMSLDATSAAQIDTTAGYWLLTYGYALRLFFDFSGYTDIAIGIGILFGIKLPENFNRPYFKTTIAAFWQSWHITLSNWVRFYVFSPLSRSLLTRKPRPPAALVVFITQMATMLIIGLWHGVTWHFFIWGAWHGVGLFVHKQWSDRTRKWYLRLKARPVYHRLWTAFAWFLTFHFVVLGWVWFALPDLSLALRVFRGLLGGA